jgi:hypothetical protein
MDIIAARLRNQHLAGNTLKTAQEVVAQLGAVQSQEYAAAKWALAQRLGPTTNAQLDEFFNSGQILRTHVMRPTWHFVTPEDILWMLELTAPRISQAMAYYNRKLELDRALFDRSNQIIGTALAGGNFLTRLELERVLKTKGVSASGQRLGHIMMQAELDGVICSGPLKGKQFTYALLSERAPHAKRLGKEESLALLAQRYFKSHGPATTKDFAWWSGLTNVDAKLGVQLARNLASEIINGHEYWFGQDTKEATYIPQLTLLSVYDEYVIAYSDYTPVFPPHAQSLVKLLGNAWLNYVVVKDGHVIGSFRRQAKPKELHLEFRLVVPVSKADKALIIGAAEQYAAFFGLPLHASYTLS